MTAVVLARLATRLPYLDGTDRNGTNRRLKQLKGVSLFRGTP
jgi:hypothetical protein